MVKRMVAMGLIFLFVSIAWMILGGTVLYRTYDQDSKIKNKVTELWGNKQTQNEPSLTYMVFSKESALEPESSKVDADIQLSPRKKGLLWYSTYKVGFSGVYTFKNTTGADRQFNIRFAFPSRNAIYDNLKIKIGDRELSNLEIKDGAIQQPLFLKAGETSFFEAGYQSQGMESWIYSFGNGSRDYRNYDQNVSQIRNFSLKIKTDFARVDFPNNTMSPTDKQKNGNGWILNWQYSNLMTGLDIGLQMPQKLNPGPWVGRVTFFAPVSLLLFIFVLFMFSNIRNVKIHPMHYVFIGMAFFSFHLLMAYLVDVLPLIPSFIICSFVSIFLVVSYMRLVVGNKFAWLQIGLSQFIYLVVFSSSFFFEGFSGLTITVLCIFTLFIMMQLTAKLDWETIFGKKEKE